jgi:plastocyanin
MPKLYVDVENKLYSKKSRTRVFSDKKMEQTPKPTEAPKPKNRTMVLAVIIVAILVVVGVGVYFLTRTTTSSGCVSSSTQSCVTINDDGVCVTNAAACNFSPSNVTIAVNSKVTWTNSGGAPHTVYLCATPNHPSSAQCPTMDSPTLPSFNSTSVQNAANIAIHGGTFSYTFAQAGDYYYYCSIHQWMHGEIVVH